MKFEILDPNVSFTLNIGIVVANVLNVVYNIPQMYRTYKRKTTRDISGWFLSLRIVSNAIWVWYAIEIDSLLMLINNIVTVLSSIYVLYYKILEINNDRKFVLV